MGTCVAKQQDSKICFRCGKYVSREKTVHDCVLAKPVLYSDRECSTPLPQLTLISEKAKVDDNEMMKIKIPKNVNKTLYAWKLEPALIYPAQIRKLPLETMRHAKFQEKMTWFRINMETHRISWQKGSQILKADRWNILFSSLTGLKTLNLYKELKIEFTDEKVDDAGGLLRQWMHLCIKQIMSKETGIFKQCNTDETAYKFVWDNNVVEEVAIEAINLLGIIIGKAIFQRISLNCFLDKTILRQLCSQPVHLHDIYSYDKQLYNSWSSILKMKDVSELSLDGCAYHTHGQNDLEQIQLFPNGKNTMINNSNRQLYVTEMIHLHCTKSIEKYISALLSSVFKVIPAEFLSVFEPHQLEMIINGHPSIDLKDWKQHTVYEGIDKNDDIVKWFWESIEKQEQEGLKNLLHYCTGSTRVPILGFKYLESNRGQVKPFTLRKVEYSKENPYPKSYTCFNRLELPLYSTKQELQERMQTIMKEELNHFGLS